MNEKQRAVTMQLLKLFTIDDKTADQIATEGQIEIFYNLVFRPHLRLQILCSTQYGKSLFVALACIIITCIQHEIVAVIAPSDEKAKIIMRYYVQHLGDNPLFVSELEKNSKLDRLRMEETKERIILRRGGGIYMISVQAGNSKKGVEAAMGAGAKIVIEDEAGLIPDPIESTVFRMIAGKGPDAFYCKIGNPFYRNHFYASSKDPNYHQIFIDASRGLIEGRYTAEFLAEARRKPLYSVLYECKFPGEGMLDASGFLNLIPESRIMVRPNMGIPWSGRKVMAVDPSGEGKDLATVCIRDRFKAEIVYETPSTNPRQLAEVVWNLMQEHKILPEDVVVDAFGIGADIGKEIALVSKGKAEIYTVLVGNKPVDEEEYNARFFKRHGDELTNPDERPKDYVDIYLNLRALMYFRARGWLIAGGQLVDEDVNNSPFKNELVVVKYKRSLQGNTIQLMSKKDMQALGIPSPNRADAFALTFLRDIDAPVILTEEEEEDRRKEDADYDRHSSL